MNNENFKTKLQKIKQKRDWSEGILDSLETIILTGDDYSLFRMNPYRFSSDYGYDSKEAIDLFLYAAKEGIFVMEWLLICIRCGDAANDFRKLDEVHNHYSCSLCRRDYETSLDNSVKVSFTIHPEIKQITYHKPENLEIRDFQYKYHFSKEGRLPKSEIYFNDFFQQMERFLSFIEPYQTIETTFDFENGYLAGNNLLDDQNFLIEVSNELNPKPNHLVTIFDSNNVHVSNDKLSKGNYTLSIKNVTNHKIPVSIYQASPDFLTGYFELEFDPFLTGKSLLNSKTYHEIFKGEDSIGASGLGIRNTTILFTDLKGSTSLYERIGDMNAFALVHQHFDEISKVISKYSGYLVKTIGDSIMSSFDNPLDAIKAAKEMMKEIDEFNSKQFQREIVLKIGIHSGACIAVTLNERLDYFGQNINIAARVQSQANGDEICVTDIIIDYSGVKEELTSFNIQKEEVSLKGVKEKISINRITQISNLI
ncbi:MAG: DUF5939 domain-containing protein [Leptospiraceae bacterium]|nr:DUF5939 domain-containing protein [Leptospiraceae bacterium]